MSSNLIIDEYIREQVSVPEEPLYINKHKTWFHTGMFQQSKFFNLLSPRSYLLYCLFRAYEIRGSMTTPFYKRIKREYYDNGHIVCALSYKQMVEKTEWFRSKITRSILDLKDKRVIRIDEVDVGRRFKQQIYILGRLSEIGDDRYFIDEIINNP